MSTVTWSQRRLISTIIVAVLLTITASQAYVFVTGSARNSILAASNNGTPTNPISVTGTGTVGVNPDRAILSIGVVTQAASAQLAVQENANSVSQVYSGLSGIGIDKKNIQTSYYNIYAMTTCCNGTPVITGYQVTNQIQVTVMATSQDTEQLGERAGQVIDVAVSNGANQVSGVQFTVGGSALQAAQQTALGDAAKDAAQQAHIIAAALNISVTGVVSVTTSPSYYPPVYYAQAFTSSASARTVISPPQSLTVTVTVQVVFSTA